MWTAEAGRAPFSESSPSVWREVFLRACAGGARMGCRAVLGPLVWMVRDLWQSVRPHLGELHCSHGVSSRVPAGFDELSPGSRLSSSPAPVLRVSRIKGDLWGSEEEQPFHVSHLTRIIARGELQIVIPKKAILNIGNYIFFFSERRTVSSQCNGFFTFLTYCYYPL